MQIAILHYAAPPVIGGVERVIFYHATHLADLGHEVQVIAGRGEPFDPRVSFHRLDLVDSQHPEILALKSELDQGVHPPNFEAMVSRVEAALEPLLEGLDVLIAHNVLSLHKNLALTAALYRRAEIGKGPRLIAWHHDLAWQAERYLSDLHSGYPWDLLRQPWPNTRHVAVSEARRGDVVRTFGLSSDEVTVIPGGIDGMAFLDIDADAMGSLRRHGLLDHSPWLLLPARITRRKNIELALQTLAVLRKDFPQILLIITGPPGPHNPDNANYFDELKALRQRLELDDQVIFLTAAFGQPPGEPLMKALYRLADALILPSFEEGFGLPILEAGLARLPIFCADIPALRELAGEQACYFSPHAEPGAVADLIKGTLSSNPAAGLHRRVFGRYDWDSVVRKFVEPLLHKFG